MKYSKKLASKIVAYYGRGMPFYEIVQLEDMPSIDDIWQWRVDNPDFDAQLEDAKLRSLGKLGDDVEDILRSAEGQLVKPKDDKSHNEAVLRMAKLKIDAKLKVAEIYGLKKLAEKRILAKTVKAEIPFSNVEQYVYDPSKDGKPRRKIPSDHKLLKNKDANEIALDVLEEV